MTTPRRPIESLERRTHLSASVDWLGILTVLPDDPSIDHQITLSVDDTDLRIVTNGAEQRFARDQVRFISVRGGAGDDAIRVDEFGGSLGVAALLFGAGGDDTITAGSEWNILAGGAGNDAIRSGGGWNLVSGGAGNDLLFGGDDRDAITGDEGADTINAGAGDDYVLPGEGNDRVLAGAGNDWVYGGAGDDELFGDAGDDALIGTDGNDLLDAGPGNDRLWGTLGTNRLVGGDGTDTFYVADATLADTDATPGESLLIKSPSREHHPLLG